MKEQNTPNESALPNDVDLGFAGRTAKSFIESPLSVLLFMAVLFMGTIGLVLTPREEDPQISVPMVDIFVQYTGASADQVATQAIEPLERIMSEVAGVKHVYSASMRGRGMVTVEFHVGEQMGPSLVKVNDKLDSNMDKIPPGVGMPLVKAKGIDDVSIVNLTVWSKDLDKDGRPDVDDGQLRMLALDLQQKLKEIPDTGSSFIVGGRREQLKIEVYPERLAGYHISLDQVAQAIKGANSEQAAGNVESGGQRMTVVTGAFLNSVESIQRLVVGNFNGGPVYLRDVAKVSLGPEDATQLVAYYSGKAAEGQYRADGEPAVTIAVAKKKGSNGIEVAEKVIDKVEELKGVLVPDNVAVSVTRNYGETAREKVDELIFKIFFESVLVALLVFWAFRAIRPATVVVLVVPAVLLFTIFMAMVLGFTINRVSLFALIFSVGILVDDAIVVVENIYRRWLEAGKRDIATAVDAVREVGNPTILATFTVIAALLPMGFVRGMMGPYMFPIPALGSVAMLFSLFAAFVFTPWLAYSKLLQPTMKYLKKAEVHEHKESERLGRLFHRILTPMIESPFKRRTFKLLMWGTFLFCCTFFYFKWVQVKMLPLDNKPEFSVVLNMPEGSALPVTANMAHVIADRLRQIPEVTAIQIYAGTARPFDFNGMVRHYYLRHDPWQGEVQVQLTNKTERDRTSHQIAIEARKLVKDLTAGSGARFQVVEMPPGPPVLSDVVAEVYGPSADTRRKVAEDLTRIFEKAPSLVDVDNLMRRPYEYWRFHIDTEKALRQGISVAAINRNLAMALGSAPLGDIKRKQAVQEPIQIVLQIPFAERSQVGRLKDLPIQSMSGNTVPLGELGYFEKVLEDPIVYHKDLRGIEYVIAGVGGKYPAPIYGMFQVGDILSDEGYKAPDGVELEGTWIGPPKSDAHSAFEWGGAWTVTYETFRDMGIAFCLALVGIYILVVWEFGNFRVPALIMAPIPLTLLGIIPGHALFGAAFTATSMIGWIALAGIIVRNSILLVDFSVHEIAKGVPAHEAVINSCKARTRPILITAAALMAGSVVIMPDPIFKGMGISLLFGVFVSTILTLVVIPLGCIQANRSMCEIACARVPNATLAETGGAPAVATARVKKGGGFFSKIIALISMIFYAIRGIFLLIFQMFKKPGGSGTLPPSAPTTPGSGGDGGSDMTTASTASSASGTPIGGAASSATRAASTARSESPAAAVDASENVDGESARKKAPLSKAAAPTASTAGKKKTATKKKTAKKRSAKKASASRKANSKPKSSSGGKSTAVKKASDPASKAREGDDSGSSARRGIRLKPLSDGDNDLDLS